MTLFAVCFGLTGTVTIAAPQTTISTPLAVMVTSPEMNADIAASTQITLAATFISSDSDVTKVEFFDDRKLVGTVTEPPFQFSYHFNKPKRNFSITARVTDGAGQTALSAPVTCLASSNPQRKSTPYDYEETVAGKFKQFRLWIPEAMATLRGILVVTNSAGGDTRNSYKEAWYEQFMYLHDFAFLGTVGETSHVDSFIAMQHALQAIKTKSNHPELVNVPYATTGFSAGGGYASRLLVEAPDRVIGCAIVSSRLNFTGMTPNSAHLRTPACIISGELEEANSVIEPVLNAYRPQGALYGWMTVQGEGHSRYGQEVLAMPFLDTVMRLRYPADGNVRKSPVKLKPVNPDS